MNNYLKSLVLVLFFNAITAQQHEVHHFVTVTFTNTGDTPFKVSKVGPHGQYELGQLDKGDSNQWDQIDADTLVEFKLREKGWFAPKESNIPGDEIRNKMHEFQTRNLSVTVSPDLSYRIQPGTGMEKMAPSYEIEGFQMIEPELNEREIYDVLLGKLGVTRSAKPYQILGLAQPPATHVKDPETAARYITIIENAYKAKLRVLTPAMQKDLESKGVPEPLLKLNDILRTAYDTLIKDLK